MQVFRILLWAGLTGVLWGGSHAPARHEVQGWLGVFQAGPEQLELKWQEGLQLCLDRITIPVDGLWHETVPTFAVRHRARWVPAQGWIEVSEQHSEGRLGRYRLELAEQGRQLIKTVFALENGGQEVQVRQFRRLQTEAEQGGRR
ncbi:MAG: hypothetical protein V3T83_05275 [Acidobacteriota bacterium]